jgi:hypothetical protein
VELASGVARSSGALGQAGLVNPALRALLLQSAPYVNEAVFAQPDVVYESYWPNFARLRHVKRRYDPEDVFC